MAFGGGLNIGDLLLTLLADGSMLRRDIEQQGMAAAGAAGPAVGKKLGATMAGGLMRSGKAMEAMGRGLTTNLTVPILAAGAAITVVGVNFDTKLRQIVALTDVTADEIGNVKDKILELAPAVGKSPQELADAFYFLASGGFNAKEALDVLEVSAKAAAAGLGTTSDVTKVIGASINAFGKDVLKPKDAIDQLIRAIKDGTAEAPDFAGALGDVVGSAALLGVNFADTSGALAAMTIKGINADEAATSLNQIFRSLIKVTPQASKAFASVGLNATDLKDTLDKDGLIKFLQILSDKFEGNDEAAAKAFGNVRALRGVLALLGTDEGAATAKILQDVANGTTDLGSAFADTEGPGRKMDQAMARIQVTLIKLSDDVLPIAVDVLDQAAGFVETLTDAFTSLPEPVRHFIVQALALVAALGPVLFITGKVTKSIGGLMGAFTLLTKGKLGKKLAENLFGPLMGAGKGLASKIAAPFANAIGGAISGLAGNSVIAKATSGLGQFLGSSLGKAASVAFAAFLWLEVFNTYNRIKDELASQNNKISDDLGKQIATGTTADLQKSKAALEKGLQDINGVWDAGIFTTDTRKRLEADLAAANKELERRGAEMGPALASGIEQGRPAGEHAIEHMVSPETVKKALAPVNAAALAAGKSIPESTAKGILAAQDAPVDALQVLRMVMKNALTRGERIFRDIGILLSKDIAKGLADKRELVSFEAKRTRDVAEKDLAQLILSGGKVGGKAAAALAKALHDKNPKVRAAAKRIQAIVDAALKGTVKPAGDAGEQAGEAFRRRLRAAIGKSMQVGITIHANTKLDNGHGKAVGGPVRAGVPYPVNEATPYSEIFVPSVSGRVVTRSQAAAAIAESAGGGGGIHYSIPVSITGVLDARKPDDVARPLRQLAASGALSTRRDRERVKVPQRG